MCLSLLSSHYLTIYSLPFPVVFMLVDLFLNTRRYICTGIVAFLRKSSPTIPLSSFPEPDFFATEWDKTQAYCLTFNILRLPVMHISSQAEERELACPSPARGFLPSAGSQPHLRNPARDGPKWPLPTSGLYFQAALANRLLTTVLTQIFCITHHGSGRQRAGSTC